MVDWRPGAGPAALRRRARLLADVRTFFAARGVLEVETPLLGAAPASDPALLPFPVAYQGPHAPQGRTLYLQSSPEYAMKRLLAAWPQQPIYQICKAFRNGEAGRRHNPEFTLLEWYRPGLDHHALMDEVSALLRCLLDRPDLAVRRRSYRDVFLAYLGVDPLVADIPALQAAACAAGVADAERLTLTGDGWLDLLMVSVIEPRLGREGLDFIHGYPASQAALARLDPADPRVAQRFEAYLEGVELANGYHELTDADEQRRRFARERADLAAIEIDPGQGGRGQTADDDARPEDAALLAALAAGLPACAGVALGLDRVLMLALGMDDIDAVLSFALPRL